MIYLHLKTIRFWSMMTNLKMKKRLSLLAVGDWGGQNDVHPSTEAQQRTAVGLATVAKASDPAAVLLL